MSIKSILKAINHRPWALSEGKFSYYQEWNKVIFLHFEVSLQELRVLVPNELEIDMFEEKAYVSIVAFTMEKIRPRLLPSLSFISDFHEINVRTYVKKNGKTGVYFLSIESEKFLSSLVAKTLSGLPYKTVSMLRDENFFVSENKKDGFELKLKYEIGQEVKNKSAIDKWLTERYALFLIENKKIYKYEIHHKEWELNSIRFDELKYNYTIGNLVFKNSTPNLMHYANGIQVIAWEREQL